MKKIIKNLAKKLPYLKSVLLKAEERDILMNALGFPPGHFYSPIPSIEEIKQKQDKIFGNFPQTLPGINLNIEEQLDLLKTFKPYYDEQPFTSHKVEGLRYYFENGFYSYSDAIFLYCMIRYTQPQKIIEIGSGYSSCIMLDTNQLF